MTTTMEISGNTPSFGTKTDRAEIDTNVPFESVKEAVTLFGEMGAAERARKKSSDFPSERSAFERTRKKSSDFSPERDVVERNRGKSSDFSPEKLQESKETLMQFVQMETQLHLLQKDERKLKEKLKRGEETKKKGILQLEQLKKTADGLSSKLKLIEDSTEKARKASEIASLRVDELQETNMGSPKMDDRGLQSELANARNEQVSTANELETTKQELLKLKQEVHASEESKANAVRQAQEAKTKAEKNSERAKELEKEIDLAQKSHAYLKSATKELEKQKMEAISEKEEEVQKSKVIIEQIRKQIAEVSQEISLTEEIEKQLSITKEEIKKTQNELDIMKQKYHKDLGDSAHPIDKLRELTVEIEKAKKQESDTLLLIKAKTSEIETKNENLKKVNEETLAAKASFDHLKEESEKIKKEISELNEIDLTEEGRAAELNSELHKARAKLTVAIAAEQKAKDSVSDFTQTIQQLTAEAEDAIKEANTLNDEANKAKLEIEKKNEDLRSLNDRLQVACKELEEVKTTEVLAKERIKLLIEKTSAERASISNSADGLVISQSEFDSLSKKVEETEGLTEKKVAALMAQVDAIKAGEQELLMKLEAATREIEHLKSTEAAELENANRAEAAKMALEGELIRRRQREQEKPVHRRPTSDLMSSEKSSDRSSFVESREANTQLIIQALTANNKNVKEGTEKQYQTRPSSDSRPSTGPLEAAVKKEQQDKTMTSTISMKKKMAFPNIGRFLSFGKKKRLSTHAVIEPFAIAMNKNLSAMHPVHKILQPHLGDTMNINAFAWHTLINSDGILERTAFPGKYAMNMSAVIYKD